MREDRINFFIKQFNQQIVEITNIKKSRMVGKVC